jgi:outer membrane protein OmpA-like peptidoglycan-associated protein
MSYRNTAIGSVLALIVGLLPTSAYPEQATYIGKDATRCDIFRALSDRVPDDCLNGEKTLTMNTDVPELPHSAQTQRTFSPTLQTGSTPAQQSTPPRSRPRRQATAGPKRREPTETPARPAPTEGGEIPSGERAMAIPIAFAFDSAELTATARRQLDNVADVLTDPLFQRLVVRIEGHTDAAGSADYNLELSRRRARSVQDYLVIRHGIARSRIPATGRGEYEPFDPQRSGTGINRRVEFVNTGLAL